MKRLKAIFTIVMFILHNWKRAYKEVMDIIELFERKKKEYKELKR